jgi:ELWxxDGT repeat protein
MYYISRSSTHWTSLWKTDGENAVLVKNLRPAPTSFYERRPVEMLNVSGTLYFTATDGEHGYELWKSDGTAEGTVIVKDINTYDQSLTATAPTMLTNVDGALYFVGTDPPFDMPRVWKSDGTAEGTAPLPGGPTYANRLVNFNGDLYFFFTYLFSSQLWKSDGTAAGTEQVTPFGQSLQVESGPPLVAAGDSLYFVVNDATSGRELWKSDGTAVGTKLVKDITPGAASTPIEWLMNIGERLYFTTTSGNGHQLWSSDGTTAGTALLTSLPRESNQRLDFNFTMHHGHVYFTSGSDSTLPENTRLWRTDGTAAGTVVVAELSGESPYTRDLASADDRLYLIGISPYASSTRTLVWENPMVPGSTPQLRDDMPLTWNFFLKNSVTTFKSNVYFSASDGVHGDELWRLLDSAPPAGDYTDDGAVDGADFLAWQRSFGSTATPAGSGADGDGDGTVGRGDLDVWRDNYGLPESSSPQGGVATTMAALVADEKLTTDAAAMTTMATNSPDAPADAAAARQRAREAIFAAGDFSRLFGLGGEGDLETSLRRRGRASLARRG